VFPKRNNRHSTGQGPIISGTPWLNGVKINGFSSYLFIYSFTLYLLGTCGVPIVYHGKRKIKKMQGILKNKMLAKTFWGGGRG
jgi:hypothetical protein